MRRKMAVPEDSVHTVKTRRLKNDIDIDEIKNVKCSPDSLCILLAKKDSTLHVLHVKTGELSFVCDQTKEFMWSTSADTLTQNGSPTFTVLHYNGSVEVFDVRKKSVLKKQMEEKALNHVGLLTPEDIKGVLRETSLKSIKLIDSRQTLSSDNDHVDHVTLLYNGYLVVRLSFGLASSPDVVRWFEIVKNVSSVPFLLPQQSIADVAVAKEMLYILYQHGMVVVYNMMNWTFHGWIDVFQTTEKHSKDGIGQPSRKRPTAKMINFNDSASTLHVSDDRNYVTKIDVKKYFEYFPDNLEVKDGTMTGVAKGVEGVEKDVELEKPVRNLELEQSLCGDAFWRSEISAISRKLDGGSDKTSKDKVQPLLQTEDTDVDDAVIQTPWSVIISSSSWMNNFSVIGLYPSSDSFLLWLESSETRDTPEDHYGVLCCWVEWRRTYLINVFLEKTLVAPGGQSTRPLYLLTNNSIAVPLFDTTQNELVNKIITYENVAMAEKLCYMNDWDHFAVPISALEAALKHGQLDTVAFYLKTKGKAFTTTAAESETVNAAKVLSPVPSSGSFISKQLYMKPNHSDDLTEQIKAVVDILLQTIAASSKRKHSVQFTRQLLQMSLDYVNGLMQDAVRYIDGEMGSELDRERVEDILIYLTAKTMELRSYQDGVSAFEDERITWQSRNTGTQNSMLQKWSEMDDKDVISDAIQGCHIPLAQVYFLSQTESNAAHDGSLKYITETGLRIVLEFLTNKNIASASEMIRNMGEDVIQLVRNVCLKTFDRPLRDFLVEQLRSWGELTDEELDAVEFLAILEGMYNNQSFESILIRRSQQRENIKYFGDLGLPQLSSEPVSSQTKTVLPKTGSIAPLHHASMMSRVDGGYCEVLLEWVIAWDVTTRGRLILEMFFSYEMPKRKDSVPLDNTVSAKSLWQYLKAHCETSRIRQYVHSTARSDDHDGLPRLELETCSDLSECTAFVQELILDELTRTRYFPSNILQDFSLLLHHLCRTDTLFTKDHPLHKVSSRTREPSQEPESESLLSTKVFHQKMIQYCSENNFMNLLHYYLDFYRLCQTTVECEELLPDNVSSEVDMLLKYRLVGLSPSDPAMVSSMSFSNSKALFHSTSSSVMEMLDNKRPIMAVATCLYAPVDLAKILNPSLRTELEDVWQLDEGILRTSLSDHPRLFSALFPRIANQNFKENPDITLYELLQGNCSFEISGLFSWQSTNNLATKGGISTDMPNFSHKALVEKFGHKETLTYVYFLKHGRPSFAFTSFMAKYQHRKYIPKASVSKATRKAYQMAITHFDNNRIVCSCVAFLELLTVDTTFLRIDVAATKRCLHPRNREELQCTTMEELKNSVTAILMRSVTDKQHKPRVLVKILESSTKSIISKEGFERTSREASQYWSLPILFCRSHNMTLTPAFLIDCAKADKWLMFLCHAQAAQFPKNQVLSILQHHFESNTLKEHLHQAVVNIFTVDIKDNATLKRKGKVPPRRDIRSQYLSRVIGASKSPSGKSEVIPKTPGPSEPHEPIPEPMDSPTELDFELDTDLKLDEGEIWEEEQEIEMKSEVTATKVTDLNPESSPDNLFDVLSLCNEVNDSWRAVLAHTVALSRPLFAVLAACYEDANLVDCMCAWLCSIYDKEMLHPALENISDIQWHKWTLDDLLSLILIISSYGGKYVHSLARAFYLFDPDSMLLPFMRFYEAFSIHMDFEAAGTQLSYFVVQHKSVSVSDSLQQQMIIGDLSWCHRMSIGVVQNMLRSCQTMYMQVQLLKLLCHSKFGFGFTILVPDFKKLYKMSQVLEEGSVFAQCLDVISDKTELLRIMDELIQRKQFTHAKEYANLVGMSKDKVSLMEIIHKKETIQASRLWESERERIAFWENCDRYFEEQECTTAGQFFEDEAAGNSVSNREKATLLCLALKWFSGKRLSGKAVSKSSDELAELESQMWLCIINDRIHASEEARSRTAIDKFTCCESDSDLVQEGIVTVDQGFSHLIKNDQMRCMFQEILGELLDQGQITQARRLSQLFGISTKDLDIVLTCIFLAQEIINCDSLDEDIKSLLVQQDKPTLSNSLKSSGDNFVGSLSQSMQSTQADTSDLYEGMSSWTVISDNLATMENLALSCRSGKICCFRVIVAYKICQTLILGFDKVVTSDPVELLCKLLESAFDKRYQLAAQYIKAFNLDSTMIAKFVAKSITMSLKVYSGSEIQEQKIFIFNPSSKEDMNNVTSLADDQLVLGGFLFDEALNLARNRKQTKPNSSALAMEVELLISAHHCQTLACNTEGISSILKLAQLCTHALAEANEYQQMVRLLTGIGRFSEMTYIFQTLMDHHHFELLVKKGADNNTLKTALLKYLDKYYLDDTDKHNLVAIGFNMHREVAISFKTSADSQVHKLVRKGLGANNEVRTQLVSIAQTYTYAMENFKKEGCLLHALECAKKHRLVELQKHILPTGMVILNLNDRSLAEFLAKYNNFFEAYIVADAYDKHSTDVWVEPLFKHVILDGDFKYLNEICSVFAISNAILSEVALRYRTELQRNSIAMANMKKVMRCEKDIICRYKLAVDLGYKDEIDAIKQSEAGYLVRDTFR